MPHDLHAAWERAASIDPTLRLPRDAAHALERKRVRREHYSRERLFSRMTRGGLSLFGDLPVHVARVRDADPRRPLAALVRAGFPAAATARVQVGPSRTLRRLKVGEVVRRWNGGRALVSTTDLHFRGTRFERAVDTTRLSDFNILCHDPTSGREFARQIEMMTLVVSAAGNLTDNHADDCDGSNHCFVGRKLWLAWDRLEGKAAGFEDVDRDEVSGAQAAFDARTFLRLPSARWLVVGPGDTLFLPGYMAHKVITLEHYIGVGSFHVALPGCLRSLARWALHDTLDVGPRGLFEEIAAAVVRRVVRVHRAPRRVREQWGYDYLPTAFARWRRQMRPETREQLMSRPAFAAAVEAVARAAGG
jgi:hypothetical protein